MCFLFIFWYFLFHPCLTDSGSTGVTMTLRDEDESLECSAPLPWCDGLNVKCYDGIMKQVYIYIRIIEEKTKAFVFVTVHQNNIYMMNLLNIE